MNNQPIDTKTSYAMGVLTILLIGINLLTWVFIWYLVRDSYMPLVPFFLLFIPTTFVWWSFWSKVPL